MQNRKIFAWSQAAPGFLPSRGSVRSVLGWVGRDLRSGARILGVAPVLQCSGGCLEQTWGPLCSLAVEVAGAEPNAKALPWGVSVAEKPCDRCGDASFVACDVSFSLHPSKLRLQQVTGNSLLRFLYPTKDADGGRPEHGCNDGQHSPAMGQAAPFYLCCALGCAQPELLAARAVPVPAAHGQPFLHSPMVHSASAARGRLRTPQGL